MRQVNAPFNMLTFNDGYHITHHVVSICHWSEMPLHFIKNLDKYEEGGALIFKGLTFEELTFAAFAGDKGLRKLAKHVVPITPKPLSEEELVALFRRRLQPINHETTKRTVAGTTQLYVLLANQLYWGVLSAIGHPLAWVPFAAVPVFHLLCVFG